MVLIYNNQSTYPVRKIVGTSQFCLEAVCSEEDSRRVAQELKEPDRPLKFMKRQTGSGIEYLIYRLYKDGLPPEEKKILGRFTVPKFAGIRDRLGRFTVKKPTIRLRKLRSARALPVPADQDVPDVSSQEQPVSE